MAAKRYLSKWHSFFWLVVVMVVAYTTHEHFDHIDRILYNYAAKALGLVPEERTLHLLHEGEIAPKEPDVPYETKRIECPKIGVLELTDEVAAQNFAALPLSEQDLAVLLNKLSERGVKNLALSAPLVQDGDSAPIARQMLCLKLTDFENGVIGLRGRTSAEADFTPTQLRNNTIPAACVTEDDISGLPSANRAVTNKLLQTPEAERLTWAPDWLDDERLTHKPSAARERSFPLLVRWNGELLPTLPLQLAMQIKGCAAKDLIIRPGKDIKIGDITLPLDEHGRTRLQQARTTPLNIANIFDGTNSASAVPATVLLAQPIEKAQVHERSIQIAATISQLCAQEVTEQHIRPGEPGMGLLYSNPVRGWMELGILAVAALFAVRLLPFMPAFLRRVLMLAALGCVLWLAHKMLLRGEWFRLSSTLLTWLTLAFGLLFMRPALRKHIRKR